MRLIKLLPVFFLPLIVLACGHFSTQPRYPVSKESKIIIDTMDLIDLVGGSGNPRYFFDEQTGDPVGGEYTACHTTLRPRADLRYFPSKYPGNNGFREWRFGAALRGTYHLKKIAYYIGLNQYYEDSVIFYSTNDFLTFKKLAAVKLSLGDKGWRILDVNDTTTHVVVGCRLARHKVYGLGTPELCEVMYYGDLIGQREPLKTFKGFPRPFPTVDQLPGINMIMGYESNEKLRIFKHQRIMQEATWMLSAKYEKSGRKKFDYDFWNEVPWGPERTQTAMIDSANRFGRYVTLLINSGATRLKDSGVIGIRLNNINDNPYHPKSFTEGGRLFYTLAQTYGQRKYPGDKVPMTGLPVFSGFNMNYSTSNGFKNNTNISNGNELNGFWKAEDTAHALMFQDNLSYVCESQVEVDGWQKRLGDTLGLWNADSTVRMSAASLFEIDNMVPQSRYLIAKAMRTDGKNIFGRIQFNKYWHTTTAPQRGMHPVKDSAEFKLRNFATHVYKIDPSVELEYTETGFDANTSSDQNVPRTGTAWTDRQWQAICNAYILFSTTGTGIDRLYFYVASTNSEENAASRFMTTDFWINWSGGPVNIKRPSWYYLANTVRLLKGYREEALLSYIWNGKYLKKYRSVEHPDSVAYVIGRASADGGVLKTATIKTGNVTGAAVVHDLSFTAETSSQRSIVPVNGVLTIPVVTEKPLIVLVKERR